MPIENLFLPEPIAYRRMSGYVTLEELAKSSTELHANPKYLIGMNVVVDMLEVTDFDIGFSDMVDFANVTSQRHTTRGVPANICIVVGSDMGRHLAEMFRSLFDIEEDPVTVSIVDSVPEALAVLDFPPETIKYFPPHCRLND